MASPCDKDEAAAENRRNFPICAAVLDDFRAVFGDGVKLTNAVEKGKKIGNFRPDGGGEMSVKQWFRLSALIDAEEKNRKQAKGKR